MASPYSENIKYSRSLQEKYEYYQAGLNFTLLAASIQTAEFGSAKVPVALELMGWLCLLVSGVIALLRFRMQPVAHKVIAQIQQRKNLLQEYREEKAKGHKEVLFVENGERVSIEEAILELEQSVEKAFPEFKAMEARIIKQHRWHLWLFIAGFSLVFASRAYQPFVGLLCG